MLAQTYPSRYLTFGRPLLCLKIQMYVISSIKLYYFFISYLLYMNMLRTNGKCKMLSCCRSLNIQDFFFNVAVHSRDTLYDRYKHIKMYKDILKKPN